MASQVYDDLKMSVRSLECKQIKYIETVTSTINVILITSSLSTIVTRILVMGL